MSDRMDINRVLLEMRNIKAQTQALPAQNNDRTILETGKNIAELSSQSSSFDKLLNQAVNNVNDLQKASGQMAQAYEQGQPGINITDVMIASQKASVSFQAMVQVRNKLVEAYRDVMNMPV
ncbi:flagellar hook-basal body complex protein FliE [Candidatus Endobugula sertula]|uniref:Flagellar hook-basal body complex protein FliE n=1 Tax=Candidatus Endobugula sertula TaxID=62101 RepID=A0A1D2QMD0_9GAMM|nr:flagellar hook-basal body complex protein FliE [Candidatus Endobugula sertula]